VVRAQSEPNDVQPETLKIYTEHPRLFLRPQRLRLLKRERERKSLRWEQFDAMMLGRVPMPEPGFSGALYYQIAGNRDAGRQAVKWALAASPDNPASLRQMALVFDWCQDLLADAEARAISGKLQKGVADSRDSSFSAARSRLLAAIALADHVPAASAAGIESFMRDYWPRRIIAGLKSGRNVAPREDAFALMEILHAVRDNLNADLRESFPKYFKNLPLDHLMSHYPAPWPAAENDYRVPAAKNFSLEKLKEPDLNAAVLSRAAELSMVAFDSNAPESQVLQGWLMNDKYLMRGPFGIPYELMWANPYQPGLSYYHVPLVFHDDVMGWLFVRSSWEDSASWVGFFDGQLQLFRDGAVTLVNAELARDPLDLDEAIVFFGKAVHKFTVPVKETDDVFVVGLDPRRKYHIEVDDEEMFEAQADPGGILFFPGMRGGVTVRLAARPMPSR
jgi:hypothetical protein